MTTPTPTPVPPSKAKSWWALGGSLLAALIPLALQVSSVLPPPYPAIIGGVIALLTALGVYQAPYKPDNTALVPTTPAPPPYAGGASPWPQP